jgi:hypothetical protein
MVVYMIFNGKKKKKMGEILKNREKQLSSGIECTTYSSL